MIEDSFTIEDKLAEKPIELPENPYVTALKNFGLDEILAGAIDAASTTALSYLVEDSLKKIVLPIAGPIIEKIGFFPIHIKKAWDVYSTMPKKIRRNFGFYMKKAFREGSSNLTKDLLVHDPAYITSMSIGMNYFPDVPPGFLSAFSYTAAIFLVAGIDVSKDELIYWNKKRLLKKAGFEAEKYYESRFYIRADKNSEDLMETFAKEFNLAQQSSRIKYYDRYVETNLKSYSGRTPKIRLRRRQRRKNESITAAFCEDSEWVSSVQIVYTRAREEKKCVDQCRYFPTVKEKLYYLLPKANPMSIEIMPDSKAKDIVQKLVINKNYCDINFERSLAHNNELAVCVDQVVNEKPFYVVELKVFKDIKLLQQAMRFLMVEYPIVSIQTTHSKSDFISNQV